MKRFISIISLLVVLAVIAGALLMYEGHLLWKAQQLNLFLYSSTFFEEQMVVPGGFLTWLSTFFMQFMYKPWLGVSLLCAWWWLLMWLTKRTFRIPTQWTGILLIPIALLLLTIVDTGYWLYVLKLQGHFFVATIGTTAVAALLWAYRCLPDKYYLRTVFLFVVAALGYPLMGIYGLAAALLMGIWSWRLKGRSIVDSVVAVLSVVAVPLFCYRYVYYQTNLANIYYAELPLYYVTESVQTEDELSAAAAAAAMLMNKAPEEEDDRPMHQRLFSTVEEPCVMPMPPMNRDEGTEAATSSETEEPAKAPEAETPKTEEAAKAPEAETPKTEEPLKAPGSAGDDGEKEKNEINEQEILTEGGIED